jgi:hypothetical protein
VDRLGGKQVVNLSGRGLQHGNQQPQVLFAATDFEGLTLAPAPAIVANESRADDGKPAAVEHLFPLRDDYLVGIGVPRPEMAWLAEHIQDVINALQLIAKAGQAPLIILWV